MSVESDKESIDIITPTETPQLITPDPYTSLNLSPNLPPFFFPLLEIPTNLSSDWSNCWAQASIQGMQRQSWGRFGTPQPRSQFPARQQHRWETPTRTDNWSPSAVIPPPSYNTGFNGEFNMDPQNPFEMAPFQGPPSLNHGQFPQFQNPHFGSGFEGVGRDIVQLQESYCSGNESLAYLHQQPPAWEHPGPSDFTGNDFHSGNRGHFGDSQNSFGYESSHVHTRDYRPHPGQTRAPMNRVGHPMKRERPVKAAKRNSWKNALSNVPLNRISGDQVSVVPKPAITKVASTVPAPPTPALLYHYTTLEDLPSIINDKCLKIRDYGNGNSLGSAQSPEKTSRWGHGIYFTEINPHKTTEEILINNYGIERIHLSQARKTEVCFVFDSERIPELVFCEDPTCLSPTKEHRRKIWMTELPRIALQEENKFYYVRDVGGNFGAPKSVVKRPWH